MTTKASPNSLPPVSGRASRDRAWPWALFTFLSLTVCSLAAAILAFSGGGLPELGERPSWTPPAPGAGEQVQAERQSTVGFALGASVVNASAGQVRLRKTPGFQNKPADDVITTVPAGARGEVVDGPETSDGLQWWLVRFDGQEGWMAERTNQGILLLGPAR